jgi:glyoxylase I family protein
MLERVLHFTIPVKDLDRSEQFYTQLLGLTRVRRNAHMVFMRCGQDYFVLTYSEMPIAPNRGDAHNIHHAFVAKGAAYDEMKQRLRGRDIAIFKEEDRTQGTFRGRSAYFHDPDGNVLEIIDLKGDPVSETEGD